MASELVDTLESEIVRLNEWIAALERDFLGADLAFPIEWGLTASEQRVVAVILSRTTVRKDQIMTALYRDRNKDEAEPKIVDVLVCKIRKKLDPFKIVINTLWAIGYMIEEPQRTELLARLTPPPPGPRR